MKQFVFRVSESPEYKAPDPFPRFVRLLFDAETEEDALLSLALFRYEPGQTCPVHIHEQVEVYYIMKGLGMVTVSGEDTEATKDTVVYIPAGSRHRITNIGDEILEFLGIFVPPLNFQEIRVRWERTF